MDGLVFREIIIGLAEELEDEHSIDGSKKLLASESSTLENDDFKVEWLFHK